MKVDGSRMRTRSKWDQSRRFSKLRGNDHPLSSFWTVHFPPTRKMIEKSPKNIYFIQYESYFNDPFCSLVPFSRVTAEIFWTLERPLMWWIGKGFLFFNMAFGWPTAKNKFFNPTMSDLMYPTMFAIMVKYSNFWWLIVYESSNFKSCYPWPW